MGAIYLNIDVRLSNSVNSGYRIKWEYYKFDTIKYQ